MLFLIFRKSKNQGDIRTDTRVCRIRCVVLLTGWLLNELFCSELIRALWSKVSFLVFLSLKVPRLIPHSAQARFTAPQLVGSFTVLIWCHSATLQCFYLRQQIGLRKSSPRRPVSPHRRYCRSDLVPDHLKLLVEVLLCWFGTVLIRLCCEITCD